MTVNVDKKVQLARHYTHRGKVVIDLWYDDGTYEREDYDVPLTIHFKQITNKKYVKGCGYQVTPVKLKDIDGDPLYEIVFDNMFEWNKAIRWFSHANVPIIYSTNYVWEYMNHHNLVCNDYLKKFACFDIEVDPTGLDLSNISYEQPIVAVSIVGNDGREFVFNVKVNDDLSVDPDEERELLENVYAVCKQYWAVIGWNSKDFDMPYIKERSTRLGLDDLDWGMVQSFDLMHKYKEFLKRDRKPGEVTNLKLDTAGERMLGERKTGLEIRKMMKLLRDDPEQVREYVLQDSRLVMKLYDVKGIGSLCEMDVAISQHLHIFPEKTYPTYIFEIYLEQISRAHGIRMPTVWEHYQKKLKGKGAGGLVLDPTQGLQERVWACDFKSLYPNIIRTHNIGINNAVWKKSDFDKTTIKTKEGIGFKRQVKSLNALVLDELIQTRFEYRELLNDPTITETQRKWYGTMSDAYKLMLVSANGILDTGHFKYRNRRIYEACTLTGQWYTMAVKKIAERMGYVVHYGDTDSLFLSMPEGKSDRECIRSIPFIEEELNRRLKKLAVKTFNLDPNNYHIDIRFEKAYSKIYFSKKKNYVGKMFWKDYKWLDEDDEKSVDAKGIVMMKYNTIPIVKEAMTNIFEILLSNIDDEKKIKKAFILYLKKLKADFYSGKRDDLLVISQKVDTVEGYKNEPAHIKAAKKLMKLGRFEPGMNVEYIQDRSGEIILYGLEKTPVSKQTYHYYWRKSVGKWVDQIAGRDISSVRALDFGYSPPAQALI